MAKSIFLPLLVSLFVSACGASAAEFSDVFLPGNFFSPEPGKKSAPAFTRKPANAEDGPSVPTIDQIRLIPSLSAEQNKKVSAFFETFRPDMKELNEKLKSIKNDATKSEEIKKEETEKIKVEQIARRQRLLDEIKSVVTDAQMNELARLKQGEVFSTYSEAATKPETK